MAKQVVFGEIFSHKYKKTLTQIHLQIYLNIQLQIFRNMQIQIYLNIKLLSELRHGGLDITTAGSGRQGMIIPLTYDLLINVT